MIEVVENTESARAGAHYARYPSPSALEACVIHSAVLLRELCRKESSIYTQLSLHDKSADILNKIAGWSNVK